ncbi:ATP-binding cassette domain-containing protein [Janibacter terrae]|uniref:ATP-binding cassette domain-containing protein n=1 Tax=Janibacter terrae TaxID=103817 RepID=UPI0037F7C84B
MAEHAPGTGPEIGTPTVVVSHLDVKYQVFGGGRRGTPSGQGRARSLRSMVGAERMPRTREVHAVKDVSFVAHHGESIGIIGRNGSGKSTLLRAVAGLIPPSAGRLWVAGEPSLLGVNAVLMSKLSGERNIYIGAQALGLSKDEIAERFDEIVEFSGIGDAVYLPMSTYSSGMGARLRFAISTAAAPDVLMIDEALATGDGAFRQKSAERIAQIREQAGTVFLVSHSNGNIRQICDRVLWMEQGRLIADGPTDEVLPQYEATLPKRVQRKTASVPDPEVAGTRRFGGSNRFEVTAATVRGTWEPGVEGVFVVSVQRAAMGRAVAPIAARLGWPLLWVRPGSVPGSAREELERLAAERVVVVGGDEHVRPDTRVTLEEITGGPVEHVDSDDASVVSARLLQLFPPADTDTVHVTLGSSAGRAPVISQVAAAHGRAVVVCESETLPEELRTVLADLGPQRLLLSGDEEDWEAETVEALRAATGAEIEFGPDGGPMAISAALHDAVEPGGDVMITVHSTGVEMLTAIAASGHTGAPLLLTRSERLPAQVRKALVRLAPREITLVGTVDALPPRLRGGLGRIVAAGDPGTPTSS